MAEACLDYINPLTERWEASTVNLFFVGDVSEVIEGTRLLADEIGFTLAGEAEHAKVVEVIRRADESALEVVANDKGELQIFYQRNIHFFRALGLLVEALQKKEIFHIMEEPQFSMNGPMFDVSQGGAVMKVDTIKTFIRRLAMMGLDMIMLYTEDSYDVKEQPYFGYMRGRYSQEEIRDLDDYANLFGIEMIPCIQTLAHLEDVLKWSNAFGDIRDDHQTMLVGYDRTYEFIEQMIVAATAPVRSKRIHIGMDEAYKLGLGRYLQKNGLRSTFDIMNDHLHRVMEIVNKHGLKPMMWSDMYFSAIGGYSNERGEIPDHIMETMPAGMQQVYWDYYHLDEDYYRKRIEKHKQFGAPPVFAGGIWNWKGFVLNYGMTFVSMNAGLMACKNNGVHEIIATLWGDDGTECDWFSALLGLQLFAEHGYAYELDEQKLRDRFTFCTGGNYDDFMDIKYIDETPGVRAENVRQCNTSRYLLWQNPMMGMFDANIRGLGMSEHYIEMESKMAVYAQRNDPWGDVFELLRCLCSVLALKAELGIRITDAYLEDDRSRLTHLLNEELPEVVRRVQKLHEVHRDRWHRINKAFGWDVINLRYGSLLMNLDTARKRLADYLSGAVDRLEELDEPRLLFHGEEGPVSCYYYRYMVSPSRIAAND